MASTTQLRGNCQCCGRLQAVTGNRMSKHGYTVEKTGMGYGWFRGVCSGHNHAPLQQDRQQADLIVASVRAEVAELRDTANDLESGTKVLRLVEDPRTSSMRKRTDPAQMVEWQELPNYYREEVLASALWSMRRRAEAGEGFANDLEALANKVHGTRLLEVERPQAAAPILVGERRMLGKGTVASVRFVQGPRVYWRTAEGRKGWTGTQAWRKLNKLEA